jgi:peroxiredoxin
MLKLKTWLLTAVLVSLSMGVQALPKIGEAAPDFSLPDAQGRTHQLADYKDKVVVLEWTNHDCPFVRKHYDKNNMQQLQKTYTEKGVVWLSVISSAVGKQGHVSPEQAQELTISRDASPSAVLLDSDGTVGRSYGAKTTPHMYVIDKGVLRYMGGIDSIPSSDFADIPNAEPYLQTALDAVLAGEDVAKPMTRPYGCSVKY